MCNRANYSQGSDLERNLKRVLSDLAEHASQTGFYTTSYGDSPNRIYGLLQCRGDATEKQCSDCSQQATANIGKDCGNTVGGRLWYDLCVLRYENYSFVGQLSEEGWYIFNEGQNSSNPDIFNADLGNLFKNLSAKISSGSASNRYASGSGSTIGSLSHKIFALLQCWTDISIDNCSKCLSSTIDSILKTNAGRVGGQGFKGSCIARYGSERFFDESPSAPPTETPRLPPLPAETLGPPPKPPPSSNNMDDHSKKPSNKLPIILGVLGALLVVFLAACSWFATRRRLKSASSGRRDVECIAFAGMSPYDDHVGIFFAIVVYNRTLNLCRSSIKAAKTVGCAFFNIKFIYVFLNYVFRNVIEIIEN